MPKSDAQIKRGRGRPRKNPEQRTNSKNTKKQNSKSRNSKSRNSKPQSRTSKTFSKREREESEPKMFLYLQGSSDSDSESESGNNFTETDAPPHSDKIPSLTDRDRDCDSEYSYEYVTDDEDLLEESEEDDTLTITPIDYSQFNTKDHDVLILLKHIRKRDTLIARLSQDSDRSRRKNPKPGKINPLHTIKGLSKNNNIEYHCTLVDVDSAEEFTPCPNDLDCWWCDHGFDNTPVYLPKMYRDQKFYVFGNFCSYNCALRYNHEMKDPKARARSALLLNMKDKNIGSDVKVKPADRRELLKSKGGPHTIEQFRQGFSNYEESAEMDMPPMIPLVHVVKYT
jgi:hypothetical protein